ncbi:hypothetical protein V8C86DRAFT_3023129 [Haematococcus lacustris]
MPVTRPVAAFVSLVCFIYSVRAASVQPSFVVASSASLPVPVTLWDSEFKPTSCNNVVQCSVAGVSFPALSHAFLPTGGLRATCNVPGRLLAQANTLSVRIKCGAEITSSATVTVATKLQCPSSTLLPLSILSTPGQGLQVFTMELGLAGGSAIDAHCYLTMPTASMAPLPLGAPRTTNLDRATIPSY